MKRIILVALIISLSVFLAGAAFAEGKKALSGNVQTDIKFCLGKISLLEEKIEALETAPQNVPVTQYRQEDEIDPSSPWWWERWGEEDPSDF